MRPSLKKSIADSPVQGFEHYAKGSIVICVSCARPIFRLDVGIGLGQKAGAAANAFKPLTLVDLQLLAEREDIDAGVRALILGWTSEQRKAHIDALREMQTGDLMLCPVCRDVFVQVLSVEKEEAFDRAYVLELLTIAPVGAGASSPIRGRQIGANKGWVH